MGLWQKPKRQPNGAIAAKKNVDVQQLTLRLKSIVDQGNIEVIQLALQSIIDELEENQQGVC